MANRVRPDIIIVTESRLEPKYLNAEFFPPEFEVHRKDRIGKGGGGVFVAINSKFTSTVDTDLDTDCELLWTKVKMRGHKDLCIGIFYRPTGDAESLAQLEASLSRMSSTTNGHIILAGDFNLAGIDWETDEVITGAATPGEARKLLAIFDDFGLHQSNAKPTRKNNILDLFISNAPSLVNRIEVPPGLSYHDAIFAEFDVSLQGRKITRSKIKVYNKMETDKFEKYLKLWEEDFDKKKPWSQ